MTIMSHYDPSSHKNSKTKVVTIKGVDSHLYAHFSKLVNFTPAGSGKVFSHLLHHYLLNIKPLIPVAPKRRLINPDDDLRYEVIENQLHLKITKKDFEVIGLNVQFVFINIEDLEFDESIDTDIFVKYVHSIQKSKVTVHGKVSKLVLLSIDRSNQRTLKRTDSEKDVTIRNVSVPVYEEFAAQCHAEQITMGEGMSLMLSHMIPHLEVVELVKKLHNPLKPLPIIISLRNEVIADSQDLIDIGNRTVLFHRVNKLKFNSGISNELFTEKILGIYNCEQVEFPSGLPILLQLAKNKKYP